EGPASDSQLLDRAPRSWSEFQADAVASGTELGTRHGADTFITDFGVGDEIADSGGVRDWDGHLRIGPDAKDDVDQWASGDHSRPDRYYNANKVTQHEVAHGVNPTDVADYATDEGRTLEEAL